MVSWAVSRRLANIRSAMVLRIPRKGIALAEAEACGADAAACSTSSLVMRPRGPVPTTAARSTFSSAASLRATGEAATRFPGLAFGSSALAAGWGGSDDSPCTAMSRFGVGFGSTSGIVSPSA